MRRLLRTIRRFLSELRRRKIYRVALAYLATGLVVLELADIAAGTFNLPSWFGPIVWTLAGLGFPIALVIVWAFDLNDQPGFCVEFKMDDGTPTQMVLHQPNGTFTAEGKQAQCPLPTSKLTTLTRIPITQIQK